MKFVIVKKIWVKSVLLATAGTVFPVVAHGQTSASVDDSADIIVTANRRAERLQDVPIAVNVLSTQALRSANVSDTQFLANLVPGLSITKTNSSQYFLRGIGTSSTTVNSEQSVAAYIDGVYVYTTYGSLSLANLERVEVLRGPQGTLFGRNTTGGVIQAVTRDPLAAPSLEGEIGYGNYRTVTGKFYGNVHLASNLGVSLAVDFRDQGRGYGFNRIANEATFFRDDVTARAKIAYEPTDNSTITAFFQYRHIKDSGINYIPIAGTRGLDGVDGSAYGRFDVRAEAKNAFRFDSYLGYLRVEQNVLDFARLTSITSYHDAQPLAHFDQDATPLNIVTAVQTLRYRNVSQEIQLASQGSTPLSWVVGAYYYNALATILPLDLTGSFTGAAGQLRYFRKQRSESIAGFWQLTYAFAPHSKITAGLRYTREEAKLPEGLYTLVGRDPNPMRLPFAADNQDSDGWTWRLALDHQFTGSIMGYVSWNRGLKSGGFTLSGATKLPGYSPESLDSYEGGLKMSFLNGRVRINPAAFLYKFRDIQYSVLTAGGSAITNAARATISGFDLDMGVKVSGRLELNSAFEYLHSRFDSFSNATFFIPVKAPGGGAVTLNNQNADGHSLPYAPKTSASFGFGYTAPLGGGDLRFDGTARYADDQFVGPSNLFVNPSYTLVSAGLGWTSGDRRLGVRLWADNLFDRNYSTQVFESAVGVFRIPGPPRTYGVTLSTKLF
ncbi:TonB-dependent receptor [Sphingobium sp. EM0848]|uniref:TonB-dependent receptor n=1 Tax=Sphingobium sp. EM0848 TaxID=2743473 RepID=UPI00159C5BDF|nr:TonB-dependent receptor [Sphingobium sp. EM0848]